MTLGLLVVAFGAGLALAPAYRPYPELAASSLYDLRQTRGLLGFVAKLHYLVGHLTLLAAGLALLQGAMRGAYRGRWRRSWGLGLLLVVVATGSAISGRMLAWDEIARWLALRGGSGVGSSALAWIWALHSLWLPCLLLLVAVAWWRSWPSPGEER